MNHQLKMGKLKFPSGMSVNSIDHIVVIFKLLDDVRSGAFSLIVFFPRLPALTIPGIRRLLFSVGLTYRKVIL